MHILLHRGCPTSCLMTSSELPCGEVAGDILLMILIGISLENSLYCSTLTLYVDLAFPVIIWCSSVYTVTPSLAVICFEPFSDSDSLKLSLRQPICTRTGTGKACSCDVLDGHLSTSCCSLHAHFGIIPAQQNK